MNTNDEVLICGTSTYAGMRGRVERVLLDSVIVDPRWPKGDKRSGALVMVDKGNVRPSH